MISSVRNFQLSAGKLQLPASFFLNNFDKIERILDYFFDTHYSDDTCM